MEDDKADDKADIQKKYLEMQMLSQQMQQLQKQLQMVETQLADIKGSVVGLDEMETVKPGSEMFVPILGGIFAKAKLVDAEKLLVNIGGGVVIEKTVPQAREMLKQQETELIRYRDEISTYVQSMTLRAKQIEKELANSLRNSQESNAEDTEHPQKK